MTDSEPKPLPWDASGQGNAIPTPVTIPSQAVAGLVRQALQPELNDLLAEVRHHLVRIEELLERLVKP